MVVYWSMILRSGKTMAAAPNATAEVTAGMQQLAIGLPPPIELWVGGTGAQCAAGGLNRPGVVLLHDLESFERNLIRLKSSYFRAEVQ